YPPAGTPGCAGWTRGGRSARPALGGQRRTRSVPPAGSRQGALPGSGRPCLSPTEAGELRLRRRHRPEGRCYSATLPRAEHLGGERCGVGRQRDRGVAEAGVAVGEGGELGGV